MDNNKSNSCFHIQIGQPLCKGMLKKQGGRIKTWKVRYFELEDSILSYYKTSDKKKLCGQFDVRGLYVTMEQSGDVGSDAGDQEKYLFAIRPGSDKHRINESHDFYLFSTTSKEERAEWVKQLKKVMYGHKGGAVFGYPLEQTMQWAASKGYLVPKVVKDSVEFIIKYGLDTPGVCRMSGQTTVVRRLADAYDRGEDVDLNPDEYDVHTVVSLLKLYFRELPEPIVPHSLYDRLKASGYSINMNQNIDRFVETLSHLPPANYNLLKLLCDMLHKVSRNSEVNLMNVQNLACVFATNILRCQDGDVDIDISANELVTTTVAAFIDKCDVLFAKDFMEISVTEEFSQMTFDNAQMSLASSMNSLDNRSSSIAASASNDTLQSHIPVPSNLGGANSNGFKNLKKRMKSFKLKNSNSNAKPNTIQRSSSDHDVLDAGHPQITVVTIGSDSPPRHSTGHKRESSEANKDSESQDNQEGLSSDLEFCQQAVGDATSSEALREVYEQMLKLKDDEVSRLAYQLEMLEAKFTTHSSSDSELEAAKERHRIELEKQRDIFNSELTENHNVVLRLQDQIDCLQNENQQLKLQVEQMLDSRSSPTQLRNGKVHQSSDHPGGRTIKTDCSKEEIAEMESRIHYLECQLNSVKLRPGNAGCTCQCHTSSKAEEDVSISSSSSFSNDSHTGTSHGDFKSLYMEQMDAYKLLVEEGRRKREEFQRLLDQKESEIRELRHHHSSDVSTPPSTSLLSLSSTSPDQAENAHQEDSR